ncbi:unnamed protein product [Linum tenue]|nr:unnamed protein product [Linum tenue]
MGIPGWRVAFHLVAIISVVVGILVRLFAHDPQFSEDNNKQQQNSPPRTFVSEMKELMREARSVMKIPSFQIIVAQGVSGSFPWSALSFAPMWLELVGFSHEKTALLMTFFTVAISIGALFGGIMGDALAKRLPNSGRIILSQISSGSAIPLAAVLLLVLPDDPSTGFIHGLVLFVMGLSISWNSPATNNPIFAEIVPEKSRTSIYALDRSFESILASFAPPVVGILAQHVYGYKVPKRSSSAESSVQIETDRENAASLAKALYSAICIPMAVCCLIYSFLYCTYPRDRDRAKMSALIESELQQLDDDYGDDEQTVMDIEYGKEDEENNVGLDESDEKSLLSDDQVSKLDHR